MSCVKLFIGNGGVICMQWLKRMGSSYVGFAVGTIFGAVIATLTSYYVFSIALGDLDGAKVFGIQDCLVEKLNE